MSEWVEFDNYQLSLTDAERQAEAEELKRLRYAVQMLTLACNTAADILRCDVTPQGRRLAQDVIEDALRKVGG